MLCGIDEARAVLVVVVVDILLSLLFFLLFNGSLNPSCGALSTLFRTAVGRLGGKTLQFQVVRPKKRACVSKEAIFVILIAPFLCDHGLLELFESGG